MHGAQWLRAVFNVSTCVHAEARGWEKYVFALGQSHIPSMIARGFLTFSLVACLFGCIGFAVDETKRDISGAALRQTHGGNGAGSSEGGAGDWNGGGCNPADDRNPADGCDGPGNSSGDLSVT